MQASQGKCPARLHAEDNQSTYNTFGFSAGARFLHRFLLFKPGARTQKAVCCSAGWYTMPDDNVTFPYGLKETPVTLSSLEIFFSRRIIVLVGEADNDPNASGLRRTGQSDKQGTNRLDRARYFYDSSNVIAAQLDDQFNWQYITLPKVTHDFQTLGEYAMDNVIKF